MLEGGALECGLCELGRRALEYAAHGWAVFPVWGVDQGGRCLCGGAPNCTPGKHPLVKSGHHAASTDGETIRRWWGRHPRANIGLNCEASGVVVVDVDPRNGGRETERRLIAEHGPFQGPVCAGTGGGGEHHFFRPPAGDWTTSAASERPGIDLKRSGYVVLPPSAHASGKGYAWQPGRDPGGHLLLDSLPPLPAAFLAGATAVVGEDEDDDGFGDVLFEQRTDLTPEQFASAVRAVPNDETFSDRESWLEFGSAIHHQTEGSEAGLALFEDWSRGWSGGAYDERATRSVWKSLGKPRRGRRPKTGAFVLWHAKRVGWKNPKQTALSIGGDVANAEAFAERHAGRFRHVRQTKTWLQWDGVRWTPCHRGEEVQAAKAFAKDEFSAAAVAFREGESASDKARLADATALIKSAPKLHAMLDLARTDPAIVASPADFDSDPWLLGVKNGVLDLRSGTLTPPLPVQMISRQGGAAFDPAATAPKWLDFLARTQPNPEVRQFLQRAVGLTLTGIVDEEVLFFCHGVGANGKSVFANVVAAVLNEFSVTVGSKLLTKSFNTSEADRLVTRLPGARLALANETAQGDVWDDQRLKDLTSRERISARMLYAEAFDFMPTHKLWIRGNHLPGSHDAGDAFWRRLIPIDFAVQIPAAERVADLDRQIIAAELPGVLNWALAGCLAWQAAGRLVVPAPIKSAAEGYRGETDILGAWVDERTEKAAGERTPMSVAFEDFRRFCQDQNLRAPSKIEFSRQMSARGLGSSGSRKSGRQIQGLRMRNLFDDRQDGEGVE